MDSRHLDQNHLGGHRVPSFFDGIQFEGSIEGEREKFLRQAWEEVVVEDRPDRAETTMEVQTTPHRQHRKLPGQQNLVETR